MKILILHNDNLPETFEAKFFPDDEVKKQVMRVSVDDDNYDSFVTERLGQFLSADSFDLIVLPYTLGEYNAMEYSGLCIAMHIRLTDKWKHNRKPILFVGPDTREQVTKFSDLGELLSSSHIFTTSKKTVEELQKIFVYIREKITPEMSEEQYSYFLNRIHVVAPANYGTHHSIANEWTILRWKEMLSWPDGEPEIEKNDFSDMLYFKYLMAKVGLREKYGRKNRQIPQMEGIKGKRVVYIDDEYAKGWKVLLEKIFTLSGVELLCYEGFNPSWDKNTLISHINDYVDENDADCYLLDLRLHDEDFDCNPEKITGHEVAKHIKKINKGNQIVIFTASDKVWNLKEDIFTIGASGYVIKESPELNYTREDSYRIYCDFLKTIKKAMDQAYIREYVNFLTKLGNKFALLDHVVDLFLLNKEVTYKYIALNLIVFLESYLKDKFTLIGNDLFVKGISNVHCSFDSRCIIFSDDFSKVTFYEKAVPLTIDQKVADTGKDLTQIIIPLKYYYQFSDLNCNLIVRLKQERNTSIAHNGGTMNLSLQDLKEVFYNVVKVILTKDFPV